MLTPENVRFVRQAGATAIVAHLLSYFGGNDSPGFEAAASDGSGFAVSDSFCQGAVAELADSDIYEAIERNSSQGSIARVHFRNVRGKVPR